MLILVKLLLLFFVRKGSEKYDILSLLVVYAYSVFHRFRQVKFDNDFKLEQIFTTAPAALKNEARFKSGQNRLKINGSLTII
jgi:hypothetical protein